jgi:phosphoglycolate phosphatase
MRSNPLRPFDLLVFDWDGTLIDSIGSIVGCTRRALEELGLPPVEDEIIRSGIGLGLRDAVEGLAPGCDENTFARICDAYRKHWRATFSHASSLFAESAATLERLRNQGYRLAVATAKGREGLDRDLAATGVAALFEATRTVTESAAKPDPGMVLDLLEETLCERGRTLVIGDSVHDIQMARNARVAAVGVSSGTTGCRALVAGGALTCLSGVADLPRWLDSRRAADSGREGVATARGSYPEEAQ